MKTEIRILSEENGHNPKKEEENGHKSGKLKKTKL
jgi:hypothetical protein